MRRLRTAIVWGLGLVVLSIGLGEPLTRPAAHASDPAHDRRMFEAFRRVASLGFESILLYVFSDKETLRKLDRLDEGEDLILDYDGDGTRDAIVWKEGTTRVIAVPAGGGTLPEDPRNDRTDVCYLTDQGSDGIPDRLVEYRDTDGDGRTNRQTIYEITSGELSAPGIGVFIYLDLDGNNRFLQTTDYSYHSARDMWGSDFNGNICLIAGYRDEETGEWHSAYENPFCFYDDDGDGFTDQAIRYAGEDLHLDTIRWSFDADGDAPRRGTHDYDFSLTATGPVTAPDQMADSVMLRDGRPMRFVSWDHGRDLARWALWRSVLLVWDEDDRNTDASPNPAAPERWEGVIAEAFRGFPRVGGPTCGYINKRYEIDRDGSGRMGVYFSGADRRIHLAGAEQGELRVALPAEPRITGKLSLTDSDRNGYFDRYQWSTGAAETGERSIVVADESVFDVPLETEALREFWATKLSAARDEARRAFEDGAGPDSLVDTVRRAWDSIARGEAKSWAARASRSMELDRLLRDRILWEAGAGLFSPGEATNVPEQGESLDFADCLAPVVLVIDRLGSGSRARIDRGAAPELRGRGERIPGQVEDRDGDGRPDHLFFAACPSTERADLVLDPPVRLPRREEVRVDPWIPNGIAIESLRGGFIYAGGKIDCLLKRQDRLVLRGDPGRLPRPDRWGETVSFDGADPGVGGLHVRVGDRWAGDLEACENRVIRVITAGPLRAVVEIVTRIEGTEVVRRWSLAGHSSSLIEEILVRGSTPVTLGFSLPAMEEGGELHDPWGIYSFGRPAPETGAIGLAGAVLSPDSAVPVRISGRPALEVGLDPGELLRLAWTVGGAVAGDSSSAQWVARARERFAELDHMGPVYP